MKFLQDIALLKLHVVLAIDRAGLVGEDGATHHGTFDVGFLRQIPGMTILAPASIAEQKKMLSWAVEHFSGPVAVRYPRGGDRSYSGCHWNEALPNQPACHRCGKDISILTYGTLLENALDTAELLARSGIEATVLRLPVISDLPVDQLIPMIAGDTLVVMEEVNDGSGIAGELALRLSQINSSLRVLSLNLGSD